jgi:arabinose-5-phosphate isomerase
MTVASGVSTLEAHLDELIARTKDQLDFFFSRVDRSMLIKVAEHILQNSGTVFLTGVGKSGIIAKKIAATLSSCGTKALFLSPLDALHGDIGVVSGGDTILILSKSGQSDELIALSTPLRKRGVFTVAVVSDKESRLAKASDLVVFLPCEKELCPFNMIPTTSTLLQLIFGDLLAITLLRAKQFSLSDFVQNHPAGRIGKRMTFRVLDLMIKGEELPLASPQDVLIDALAEFSQKKCGCLIIVDKMRLSGIFTDGDLRRSLQKFGAQLLHKKMEEVMTKNPRSISSDVLAYDAMKCMEQDQKSPIFVLPVVDDDKVVGLLRMHDIIQAGL